jgi:hypothetical protein
MRKKDIDDRDALARSAARIVCPACGNDRDFLEVADDVVLTSRYVQNSDGSFTQVGDDSQVLGEIRLYCAECNADLTYYHQRFLDMLF